jgi:hypothetical protein
MQQMAQELVRCYSWDKLMYKGYIGNLLSEEVRSVLRFLCAKYVFPTAINRQLIEVYSDKVVRDRVAFQKMEQSSKMFERKFTMTTAPVDQTHQERVGPQHKWRSDYRKPSSHLNAADSQK